MPAPNPTWDELTTSTLHNRRGKAADNITKTAAGLKAIEESGARDPFSGGISLVEEIEYAENPNHIWYSGYEQLPIAPYDHLSAYEFPIKQAAISVTFSGLEKIQNNSKEAKIKLVASRVKNAEKTARNKQVAAFYGDGSADGGKQMGGLGLLVVEDPTTGTVGGISRVDYTIARNQKFEGIVDGGAATSAVNIRSYMTSMFVRTSRDGESVDTILAGRQKWEDYHNSLAAIQQITNQSNSFARSGFKTLEFMGVPVVLDGGYGSVLDSQYMYFLNTKYIKYRPFSERDWEPLEPASRHSINQDATVKLMVWAGNMTASCLFLQGLLFD